MNQSNDNIRQTRLGSRKTQDMSVTIDVNDVFEEVVKQNERLVKEIEFYEEVVNDLVINVKKCIVCQQNDVINDRINRLETHLKSKTIDNSTDVKSDEKDCNKNLKTKGLQKLKKITKRCIKMVTDSDTSDEDKDTDRSVKRNVKTLKKTKKNPKKKKEKTISRDGHKVKNVNQIKPYSDEYEEKRLKLKDETLSSDGHYYCQTCDYKSVRFIDFEAHVNRYHLNINPYNCDICGKHFSSNDTLRRHKSRKHYYVGQGLDQLSDKRKSQIAETLSKYQCQLCPQFMSSQSNVNRHVLHAHHKVKPTKTIACDMCDKSYSNSNTLITHKRLKHGIGEKLPFYYCDWEGCQFKTANRCMVSVHKKRHLGIRDYACDWPGCEYRAFARSDITKHSQLVHSNNYDYLCQWTGCEFRTKSEYCLKRHTNNVHKDIPRTLSCHWPGCDKSFRFPAELTKHMKTHNKPHLPCPYCNKLFTTKQYLSNHMGIHTGSIRVSCPVKGCNIQISSKANIGQHLKVHHKGWTGK